MPTVRQMLDDLAAGKRTLEEVADDFSRRPWERPKDPTPEQLYGVEDDDAPDDDSIDTLNADSRLSTEQYNTLAAAAAASHRVGAVTKNAAGVDTNPGDGNARALKNYWVHGDGATRWATWTELYHHLLKYIDSIEEAKATAANWYHERYGRWPGAHQND